MQKENQVEFMPKLPKNKKIKVLGDYNFQCPKCKLIHKKSFYCIAQQAMGHKIYFTCTCNNNFKVPNL